MNITKNARKHLINNIKVAVEILILSYKFQNRFITLLCSQTNDNYTVEYLPATAHFLLNIHVTRLQELSDLG